MHVTKRNCSVSRQARCCMSSELSALGSIQAVQCNSSVRARHPPHDRATSSGRAESQTAERVNHDSHSCEKASAGSCCATCPVPTGSTQRAGSIARRTRNIDILWRLEIHAHCGSGRDSVRGSTWRTQPDIIDGIHFESVAAIRVQPHHRARGLLSAGAVDSHTPFAAVRLQIYSKTLAVCTEWGCPTESQHCGADAGYGRLCWCRWHTRHLAEV